MHQRGVEFQNIKLAINKSILNSQSENYNMLNVQTLRFNIISVLSTHFRYALVESTEVTPNVVGDGGMFVISFNIVGGKLDNIDENPVPHKWVVWYEDDYDISVECIRGEIMVNRSISSLYLKNSIKTRWKTANGDSDDVLNAFREFSVSLGLLLLKNRNNIMGRPKYGANCF
jgi:hypothetical protein